MESAQNNRARTKGLFFNLYAFSKTNPNLYSYFLFTPFTLSGHSATKTYVSLMSKKHYFDPADLAKFGNITAWQKSMGDKFFAWYGEVMKEGALTEREKSLIALAVAHTIQCPYCIDAYTTTCLEKGSDEEQMMEAVQVAAAIRAGSTLVYSTQMMNHAEDMTM